MVGIRKVKPKKLKLCWLPGGNRRYYLDSLTLATNATEKVQQRSGCFRRGFDWVVFNGGSVRGFEWVAPNGGTSFCERSRGRQAADSIEPRVGFQLFGGGLCRGEAGSLRLFAADQLQRWLPSNRQEGPPGGCSAATDKPTSTPVYDRLFAAAEHPPRGPA